jgi:uncharacterized protein (DUF2147 family)
MSFIIFLRFQDFHVPIQRNFRSPYVPLSFATFLVWVTATSLAPAQTAPVSAGQPGPAAPPDPIGEWTVAKQVARIKIADCDGRLWGVVSWEAKPGIDQKNPDPSLKSRPTLGMPILLGMAPGKASPGKPNKWEGEIYNSEDGHTYSASISLVDPNTLRVQGCFLGFLCGGENWTRFDPPAAAPPPPQRPATKSSNSRKTTGSTAEPTDDVCSRALGSSGLSHERGLK